MKNLAMHGTGISAWEAEVLVETIEAVYFSHSGLREISDGQMKYKCVSSDEGPGKELKDCQLTTVILTIHDDNDTLDLSSNTDRGRSTESRQRRIMRIASEAKEQGGLLSQEDLSKLLMCDVRTIRRDIQSLKKKGIVVPTRGTVKDIGPGVTHREIAVRLWLEGKEPVAIKAHINHHIKSVENYLEKFKRVVYLRRQGFNTFQIALCIGISVSAANMYNEMYKRYKNTALFKDRLEEIEIVGSKYYVAQDEKKSTQQPNASTSRERRRQ
jgi:DNA-binding CsgD family transcriptional regulator